MQRTAVLNVVGLTPRLISGATPHIFDFLRGNAVARVEPAFPALTCTAQATYITGNTPKDHGIVANGWYDRDYAEHRFWKQPEGLVRGQPIWERLRQIDPDFTCAKLFWWFNRHSTADFSVTPRPIYPADGSKVFDIESNPQALASRLKRDLGAFPFPTFWGPGAAIDSSRWIASCARWIEEHHWPGLSLIYLPHLDYDLQRHGLDMPKITQALREIDDLVGSLITFFERRGVRPVILSEYGITSVDRPVHLNRVFRERGWITVKDELGRETLMLGDCKALAIADHQVAHIYLQDRSLEFLDTVRQCLLSTPGVGQVLGPAEKMFHNLEHSRSGDLIAVADARSWFTYYYWEDDRLAPDFARCVDIHRKQGYDPAELFIDPNIRHPKLKIAATLLRKKLGFRYLMDIVPLDASLVRGSHGRIPEDKDDWPMLIGDFEDLVDGATIPADHVYHYIYRHCSRGQGYGSPAL